MNKDVNILDIILPIWNARYSILLHLTLFVLISFSLLSLVSYLYNVNKSQYWLQDISFNEKIGASNITNFLNDERISRAYETANLVYKKDSELISISLLKGTSRFDILKDTVLADAEELLVKVINEKDEDIIGFWNNFLNLETSYYQIVFKDDN